MRVTILGSGTGFPDAERFAPAVLVQTPDALVLFDAGPGILRRLAQAKVDPRQLDAVVLTHFHVDHCAGVPELLFAFWHPRLLRSRPLSIWGGPGLSRWMGGLRTSWPKHTAGNGYELSEHELDPGIHPIRDMRLDAIRVAHKPESLAFRVHGPSGEVLALSGDSSPCEGLIACARAADLFLCECTTVTELPAPSHLTARQAGAAAACAGSRRLCLTHLGPDTVGVDIAARAAEAYRGPIVVAHDLLELEICAE